MHNQVLSAGSAQYSYDGGSSGVAGTAKAICGSAANRPVTQYAWDAADRLAGVTLPDGTAAVYTYDADGRRVQQVVGTEEVNYLWDEASAYGDVVLETDGSGDPIASYVLGGTELIAQQRDGSTSYYLHDGQGSVRGLADGTGTVTDRYDYTAYGEPLAQQGTTENAYRYTGQYVDNVTGLYNLRARYYAPGDGRFLSRDPFEGTMYGARELNRYAYAANSPVNLMDPMGWAALLETGKLDIKSAATTGALSGYFTGFIGTLLFHVIARIGGCGEEAYDVARRMSVTDVLALGFRNALFGMAIGAVASVAIAISGYVAPVLSGIGAGASAYDMIKNGSNWCNSIGLVLSVAPLILPALQVPKLCSTCSIGSGSGGTAALQRQSTIIWTGVSVTPGVVVVTSAGSLVATAVASGVAVAGRKDPTLSYGTNSGNTKDNASLLRKAMEAAGIKFKQGEAAHHIVPSTHQYESAIKAREILQFFGIDINSAENGVPLPQPLHSPLHSHAYMDKVLSWLQQANTQAEAEQILTAIGQLIRAGKFP